MSLYSAFDKNKHFSELDDPLIDHEEGTLSSTVRKERCLANLGLSATLVTPDTLTTEAGAGITGNTGGGSYSSSVRRVGDVIITQIFIDVDGLDSSTTDLDVIGFDAATDLAAHLGQITEAQNGVIYEGTMACLEAPTGGVTDIDLYSATVATAVFDDGIAALDEHALVTSGAAWTLGRVATFTRLPRANDYLYLTGGAAGTAAEYTAGQFVITLHGLAA